MQITVVVALFLALAILVTSDAAEASRRRRRRSERYNVVLKDTKGIKCRGDGNFLHRILEQDANAVLGRCKYDRFDLEKGRAKLDFCTYMCEAGQRVVQPARCRHRAEPRISCSKRRGVELNGHTPLTCADRSFEQLGMVPGGSKAELGQLAWTPDRTLLAVAGGDSGTVLRINPDDGTTTVVAGVQGDLTPLGTKAAEPVATTPVGRVDGVAVRQNGNYLFSSMDNGYIAEVSGANVQRIAGEVGTGDATLVYGEGEPAADAFLLPGALFLAPSGRLFFTEPEKGVIRVVELDGTLSTIAGLAPARMGGPVPRELGYAGESGQARNARFDQVGGLALDPSGRYLYVTDDVANVVRRIDLATGGIEKGAGTAGSTSSGGNGLDAFFAAFAEATDVAVDEDGSVFILDGVDEVVRKIDHCTDTISTFARLDDLSSEDLAAPRSLLLGSSETLFWTGTSQVGVQKDEGVLEVAEEVNA